MDQGDLPFHHPGGLEDILSRERGIWSFMGCMLRVLRNACTLQPVEISDRALQGRVLRWLNPVFILSQAGVGAWASFCLRPFATSETHLLFVLYAFSLLAMHMLLYLFSEDRVTIAPCSHFIRFLAVLVALFWVIVFNNFIPFNNNAGQVFVCVSGIALMGSSGILSFVSGAGGIYAGIICGGLLWRIGQYYISFGGNSFYIASIFIVISYLFFATCTFATIKTLFIDYLINRSFLKQRNNILSLLLGDPKDTLGDWLWETDAEGRIRDISPVFARAIEQTNLELQNRSLISALSYRKGQESCHQGALGRLESCLERRIFFRDLVIGVPMREGRRFWSLSGRPIFRDQVFMGYRGVGTDVTEAHHAQKTASFRARHDSLTGLPNRAAFFDDMEDYLLEATRRNEAFALLNLDLDGFKQVNDRYGHHYGDEMLEKVSVMMSQVLGNHHRLYRMGGDEFVLVEECATEISASEIAGLLVNTLSTQPVLLRDGVSCAIGLSVGIMMARGGSDDVEALLAASDLALYESKKRGGNNFCFYDASLESLARRNRVLGADLADLLRVTETHDESGQADATGEKIEIRYQPFFDAQSQVLTGFEALVSWRHEEYGRIMPDQIIALAEEAGLMEKLGMYVLEHAASFACTWPKNRRSKNLVLSVNISVSQLLEDHFVEDCLTILQKTGLQPEQLQLEVTETIFMRKIGATSVKLNNLREHGISIALDDFGKGFSCLSYLHYFPFSKIKLDKLFVQDMLHESRAASIVRAVIGLAVDLGVAVTAEGVETEEQLRQLVRLGCTEVQGYLFARPLRAEDVMRFVGEDSGVARRLQKKILYPVKGSANLC